MKKTFSSKKSAFSLIELSIVLIVIGLLVAGVTGGASLIKSSELRSVMSEARGYSVAVSGFFSQFNALPGDFGTSLGTPANTSGTITFDNDSVNLDNDKIEYCASCSTTAGTLDGSESTIAWYHLKQSGAIDTVITYASAGTAQSAQTNFPASKVKASGWVFDYNTNTKQNVVVLTASMDLSESGNTPVNGTPIAAAAITPSDALSIDSKIDDGIANSGKIRAVLADCSAAADSPNYKVTDKDKKCALSYQVDVNS
jgi:prepilin-type N-terminal cleavage/methylation domain-containing protein